MRRNPAIQPLALQAGGKRKAAKEQKDDRIRELQQRVVEGQHPRKRRQQRHEQGRHADMQGLGDP